MLNSMHKSYLRDSHGPRAVDAGQSREKSRNDSRRQRDGDDSGKHRSKRSSSRHPSKSESSSHRRKTSTSNGSCASSTGSERPTFEIHIIQQPKTHIGLGATVGAAVIISLRLPSPEVVDSYRSLDTSRLIGVVTLLEETRSGERIEMENGYLTGQKAFDSVHPIPAEYEESLARSQPCRLALGYCNFPDLLIRQHGMYRLQVSLLMMGSSAAPRMASVDSETIKVDRPRTISGNPRKHQRA